MNMYIKLFSQFIIESNELHIQIKYPQCTLIKLRGNFDAWLKPEAGEIIFTRVRSIMVFLFSTPINSIISVF